ncbi:gustatory receptor for bitter taste 93a-like [Episyrphus balteatus]|uniref:gustatory receptor for bitter taste 93a-like n=1 Tax=Episyrphus balteatus TaxID=286459 RepID=UPI002485A47B|nr:gustatory receptor for bitter taste 93a-like [Episyrphus balteatus]
MFSDFCTYFFDIPEFLNVTVKNEFLRPVFGVFIYTASLGGLILADVLTLGYLLSSGMYHRIGKYLINLAQRITISERFPMTNYRQMAVLCEYSDELDECSEIFWNIYGISHEFHNIFQINNLFVFVADLIMIISYVHQSFLVYINTGIILWGNVIFGIIRIIDFLLFIWTIELISQRSRIPNNIDWETLFSDMEPRWDRSVDKFLTQLRLQEFKLDVYGLFSLNNRLCLRVTSIIVAYLTIIIQFKLMGY